MRTTSPRRTVDLDGVLTIEGAAARREVSSSTIRRAIADGRLHARRVLGRIVVDVAAVDALDLVEGGGRR